MIASIMAGVVAPVFLVAAAAKFADPIAAARAAASFGLPVRPSSTTGHSIAVIEAGAGLGILIAPYTARWTAGLACVLGLAFVVLTSAAVIRQSTFSCACFGGEAVVGRTTVLRACGVAGASATVFFHYEGLGDAFAEAAGLCVFAIITSSVAIRSLRRTLRPMQTSRLR